MPPAHAPPTRVRPPRKGHYSCDFCRARKLRCSRPLPCINCVSRGKKCVLGIVDGHDYTEDEARHDASQDHNHSGQTPDDHLLEEVHRLRRLAEDLERRVGQIRGGRDGRDDNGRRYAPKEMPTRLQPLEPPLEPPDLGPICAVVTHLDRMSMGKGSYAERPTASSTASPSALSSTTVTTAATPERTSLLLKIEPIFAIPSALEYAFSIIDGDRLHAPRRCVYLPTVRETSVLLETFLSTVSSFYHIVHHPTVPDTVRRIYDCVQSRQDPPLGDVLLLLSIIATGTCLYDAPPNTGDRLFASRDAAARQTPYWIQAALHVLEVVLRGPAPPTLSAVQGVITLSFLISNVEGVGFRYRSIVSTGLMLGRELGLHCIDQVPAPGGGTPFEDELGRRAWWYLASTDWLLAARNSGPGVGVYQTHPHMMRVHEPAHVDDAQLSPDATGPIPQVSRDTPTDMSYFLQRVRLAQVARGIVDRMPMVSGTQFVGAGRDGDDALLNAYRQAAMASDADLDAMVRDLPPFLQLEAYADEIAPFDNNTFIQAFMLHSLINTQRCKLHLSYLTSWRRQAGHAPSRSPPVSPSSSSRAICIEAARQILHAETQLRRRASQHPYFQSRLACVLYGVFLATIVLLIDLCADTDDDSSTQKRDALAALQIVADARHHSPAAAELYASLTQLLGKHRPQMLEEFQGEGGTTIVVETLVDAPLTLDAGGAHGYTSALFNDNPYGNPLALNFDGMGDLVDFQWEDLLAGVDTSMFM